MVGGVAGSEASWGRWARTWSGARGWVTGGVGWVGVVVRRLRHRRRMGRRWLGLAATAATTAAAAATATAAAATAAATAAGSAGP